MARNRYWYMNIYFIDKQGKQGGDASELIIKIILAIIGAANFLIEKSLYLIQANSEFSALI